MKASSSSTATCSTMTAATASFAPALPRLGVALVAAYCGANFIFPDILRRGACAASAGRRRGGRRSARSTSSWAAAPSALEGLAADDYEALAAALDEVVAVAKARGLQGALPSAPLDDRRGPERGATRSSRITRSASAPTPRTSPRPAAMSPAMVREHACPHLLRPSEGLAAETLRLHAGRTRATSTTAP